MKKNSHVSFPKPDNVQIHYTNIICLIRTMYENINLGSAKDHKTTLVDTQTNAPVDSKTRTYHGRVGSERTAGRPGGVGQNRTPTQYSAQETSAPRTLQGFANKSLERLSRSTNKRNPM